MCASTTGIDVHYGHDPVHGRRMPDVALRTGGHLSDLLHKGRPVTLTSADADLPFPGVEELTVRPDGYVA